MQALEQEAISNRKYLFKLNQVIKLICIELEIKHEYEPCKQRGELIHKNASF